MATEFAKLNPNSNVRFIWIGGSEPLLLDAMPEGRFPDNVQFTGFVPFEDLLGGYSTADVFLLPTRAESYGNVVLEAASCGLPIVLRNIPAFDGWLTEAKDCVKCSTTQDFVRAVDMLWKDNAMRNILCKGSEKLAQTHNIVNTARRLYEIYSGMMEEKR